MHFLEIFFSFFFYSLRIDLIWRSLSVCPVQSNSIFGEKEREALKKRMKRKPFFVVVVFYSHFPLIFSAIRWAIRNANIVERTKSRHRKKWVIKWNGSEIFEQSKCTGINQNGFGANARKNCFIFRSAGADSSVGFDVRYFVSIVNRKNREQKKILFTSTERA